jgi:hypothetical protein
MRGSALVLGSLLLLGCQKQASEPPKPAATPAPAPAAPAAAPAPATTTSVDWVHPQKLMSIRFPGKPEESEQQTDTPLGPIKFTMAIHAGQTRAFMAGATVYKLAAGQSFDVAKALDGARDQMLASIKAKATSEKAIELDGLTGREVTFEAPGPKGAKVLGTARVYAASDPPGAYVASAFRMTEAPDPDAVPFLDSMHLGKAVQGK